MYLIARIAVMMITILAIVPPALAQGCPALLKGLESWESEMKNAIRDEPEDLPKELARYSKALESQDAAQADRIQQKIRNGYNGLKAISPPSEVAVMHSDMIDYYRAGVAVLDARNSGDHQARHAAEIDTWLGLKRFFTNVRDLFVEHDCNAGDVEAIEEHYLPELEKQLAEMLMGGSLPAHY